MAKKHDLVVWPNDLFVTHVHGETVTYPRWQVGTVVRADRSGLVREAVTPDGTVARWAEGEYGKRLTVSALEFRVKEFLAACHGVCFESLEQVRELAAPFRTTSEGAA